jgi:hypothetical protein
METTLRKPFQGITNIVRFNWHFYAISIFVILAIGIALPLLSNLFQLLATFILFSISATTLISILVSIYVYDLSGLYDFNWMSELQPNKALKIVTINAGFDETSSLIQQKYPNSALTVLDFYDEQIHTEISIKRARKAYPPYPNTKPVTTTKLGLESETVDLCFLIFSAHEIRNNQERALFMNEIKQSLKPNGQLILVR